MEKDAKFYDVKNIANKNALFNFLHGARGIGKSFSIKKFFVEKFLENGEQFYYLRRYKEDLPKSTKNFFQSLQVNGYFAEHKFTQDGGKNGGTFYIDGEPIGYYGALTKGKGVELPLVSYINYDEYLKDKGDQYHHYLKNEVESFLEFYESVARMRDVTVFFTSNNTDTYSPYFQYFQLKKPYGKKDFWTDGNVLLQEIKTNPLYIEEKYSTRFGKIIQNTKYGNYAVENKSLYDTSDFLKKKTPTAKLRFNVRIGKDVCGVYFDLLNGDVFFSCNHDKNVITYTLIKEHHKPNDLLVKASKSYDIMQLKKAYEYSQLFFDSPKSKNLFEKIQYIL